VKPDAPTKDCSSDLSSLLCRLYRHALSHCAFGAEGERFPARGKLHQHKLYFRRLLLYSVRIHLSTVYLQSEKPLDRRRFWIARFARIYPLFAVSLLLDLPHVFIFRLAKYGLEGALWKTTVTLAGNLVMLQAWILDLRFLNPPVWSLAVETIFYLPFPFIGWRLWKASPRAAVFGSFLLYHRLSHPEYNTCLSGTERHQLRLV